MFSDIFAASHKLLCFLKYLLLPYLSVASTDAFNVLLNNKHYLCVTMGGRAKDVL